MNSILNRIAMVQMAGKGGGSEAKNSNSLVAPDRLGDHNAPRSINAMNLKDELGQIEANSRDRRQISDTLSHGRRSFKGLL
jgi:hypothetical protein